MLRNASFLVGVLLVGQAALGQNEVVSYHYSLPNVGQTPLDIAAVPASGFVLTDVVLEAAAVQYRVLQRTDTEPGDTVLTLNGGSTKVLAFASGIPFESGSTIQIVGSTAFGDPTAITLTGYLPDTSVIPALDSIGLAILIATIAAAGGWILSRRKGFEHAA